MATQAVEQNQNTNSGGILGTLENIAGGYFGYKLTKAQIRADQMSMTGTAYGVGDDLNSQWQQTNWAKWAVIGAMVAAAGLAVYIIVKD